MRWLRPLWLLIGLSAGGFAGTILAGVLVGMKANEPRARLACQLRVSGPVTVNRRSVRRATGSESNQERGEV